MPFKDAYAELTTFNAVLALTLDPSAEAPVAVIVVAPADTPVACPLATVALVASDEFQVAEEVRSWVVASLKLPMALNCCELPTRIPGPIGVSVNDLSSAVTFKLVVLLTDPKPAMMLT